MNNVNIKMDGLDELRRKLESLTDRDDVERKALTEAGEHLRTAIQNNTPVRKGPNGGALKASIAKGEVVNGKILIGPSQQGPAFRAHFVEFGTSKMSARPFMRPAFERSKNEIEKIMAKEIRKGLKL